MSMLNCTGIEQVIITVAYRRVHGNNVSRLLIYKGCELIALDYVKLIRTRTVHEER